MNKPNIKSGAFHLEPLPFLGPDRRGPQPDAAQGAAGGGQRGPEQLAKGIWKHAYKIFALYIALLWAGTALVMVQAPTYEVSSVLALQQGLYGEETAKYSNPLRADEIARSQVALLESEDVIREANRIAGKRPTESGLLHDVAQQGSKLLASISKDAGATASWLTGDRSPEDEAYLIAKRNLKVRNEPYTNLVKISYRDADPAYAVAFTRALVQVFADKHFDLYTSARAGDFFAKRREESKMDYARASKALAEFAVKNEMFATDDEKRLLLEQRSRLISELAATRGTIAEKESEAAAIPEQLNQMKQMKKVAKHNGLIDEQRAPAAPAAKPQRGKKAAPEIDATASIPNLGSDPPLLLVRVYQETIAALVKLKTELTGLRALAEHQQNEIANVTTELGRLSAKRAEYEMLQFEAQQAKMNSEQFAKRAYEEQLSQDLKAKRLSNVQVVQEATLPLGPVWPRGLVAILAVLLSLAPLIVIPAIRRMAAAR